MQTLADLSFKDLYEGLAVMGKNGSIGKVIAINRDQWGIDLEIKWETNTIHVYQHQCTEVTVL